jgi:hypothetical protein
MYASILILVAAIGSDPKPVYDVTVKRIPFVVNVDVGQFACKIRYKGGMGSGVITEKGVVTCFHVVNGQSTVQVTCGDETADGHAVVIDRDYDLALLSVAWTKTHAVAKVSPSSPEKGARLQSAGRCKDGTITVEEHLCESNDKKDIRFSNCSNTGRSGAGLFNRSGELVGIVYGNSVDVEPFTGLARDLNHVVRLVSQYTPGKVSAAKPVVTPQSNCPNGNCPIQQPQQQYFWNRRFK